MKSKELQVMEAYEVPKVELIEVEVEKGFAVSDGTTLSDYEYDGVPFY